MDLFPTREVEASATLFAYPPDISVSGPGVAASGLVSASLPSPFPHQVIKLGIKSSYVGLHGTFYQITNPRGAFDLVTQSLPGPNPPLPRLPGPDSPAGRAAGLQSWAHRDRVRFSHRSSRRLGSCPGRVCPGSVPVHGDGARAQSRDRRGVFFRRRGCKLPLRSAIHRASGLGLGSQALPVCFHGQFCQAPSSAP